MVDRQLSVVERQFQVVEHQTQVAERRSNLARLVTGTQKYKHGLCWLMHDDLHWLIVPQQVQYKLAVTIHCWVRHRAPRYLAD